VSLVDVGRLKEIAELEFPDIIEEAIVPFENELRILLKDGSFVDVWFSLKLAGRYSYHWERRMIDGKIYRHDNAPHRNWESVTTFPKHFHEGSEDIVLESRINDTPDEALREFLSFIRDKFAGA
jgi:hypothetical protein